MCRLLLTSLMIFFMALGPVASLSAQINHSHATTQTSAEQSTTVATATTTIEQPQAQTKHSCCDDHDKCNCSFQNECDIQHLSFFAIQPQQSIPTPFTNTIIIASYTEDKTFSVLNNIYRPPITFL